MGARASGLRLPARLALLFTCMFACAIVFAATAEVAVPMTARAEDFSVTRIDSSYLYPRNGFLPELDNAKLESYSVTNPSGALVKTYEGYVSFNYETLNLVDQGHALTVRLPVRPSMDDPISIAEGQAMLNGLAIDLTFSNVGTYQGRNLILHTRLSDFRDCAAVHRDNNAPRSFGETVSDRWNRNSQEAVAALGDNQGVGYLISIGAKAQRYHIQGVQSLRVDLSFTYEDGTPVQLAAGDYLLNSVGSLDADYLGAEGTVLMGAAHGYLSKTTSLVRGSITQSTSGFLGNVVGKSPVLMGSPYTDTNATPTFYGTLPDKAISSSAKANWTNAAVANPNEYIEQMGKGYYAAPLDSAVTYTMPSSAGASTSFLLIDTVGEIGWPISLRPNTAYVPTAPVKSVDKTVAVPGEDVTFTVRQQVGLDVRDAASGYRYTGWGFSDLLDKRLEYVGLTVRDGSGADVTGRGKVSVSGQEVRFDFQGDYLAAGANSMRLDGSTYTFEVRCRMRRDVASGEVASNVATSIFNGAYRLDSNAVSVAANAATLSVREDVTYEQHVDEPISPVVTVENVDADPNSVAHDVIVHRDAPVGGITVNPSSVKVTGVPTGLPAATVAVSADGALDVTIPLLPHATPVQVGFTETAPSSANGWVVTSHVSATCSNLEWTSDVARASAVLWVNSPHLTILKSDDEAEHLVGETIPYDIRVVNTDPGTLARKVRLTDVIPAGGAPIVAGSVRVYDGRDADVTAACIVQLDAARTTLDVSFDRSLACPEGGYTSADGDDIQQHVARIPTDEQNTVRYRVHYEVAVEDQAFAGTDLKNDASVSAENAPEVSDSLAVHVTGPTDKTSPATAEKPVPYSPDPTSPTPEDRGDPDTDPYVPKPGASALPKTGVNHPIVPVLVAGGLLACSGLLLRLWKRRR